MNTFNCLFCNKENPKKGKQYANKYCNNKCQGQHTNKLWYEKNKSVFDAGLLKSRAAIKRFVSLRDGYHCSICGQQPNHNNRSLTMILDHIDGDASHNLPINFRLVCPNCDSQLPTYKSKNIGKGRTTKGMQWNSRL